MYMRNRSCSCRSSRCFLGSTHSGILPRRLRTSGCTPPLHHMYPWCKRTILFSPSRIRIGFRKSLKFSGLFSYNFKHQKHAFVIKFVIIQCVSLGTETGISLIILQLMRILQRNLQRTTDTFLFISHTTNLLLLKFRYNIFIGVTIIKEMQGLVASGTHCIFLLIV